MTPADVARHAVLELEAAHLAVTRAAHGEAGMTEQVTAHALVSIAASLVRLAGAPARDAGHADAGDTAERNVAALANSINALVARVDALEESFKPARVLGLEDGDA
jgi:hypothetical protein